jgi:hypothetical protein
MNQQIKERILAFAEKHPQFVQHVEKKNVEVKPKANFSPMAGTNIVTSIEIDQQYIDTHEGPYTVSNGTELSPVIIKFVENLTFHNTNTYFIVGSEYIIFDGKHHEIHFDIPLDEFPLYYSGVFQNGTGVEGTPNGDSFSNICIKNVNVILDYSIEWYLLPVIEIFQQSGWLCNCYFGALSTNNKIQGCYTNGDSFGSGNLIGNYSTVDVCFSYSSGLIGLPLLQILLNQSIENISFSGGIIGSYSTNCTLLNCYSSGRIGLGSGGLAGAFNDGLEILNSYALGDIFAIAGGLIGLANNDVTIKTCYSNQLLDTVFSGAFCGLGNTNVTIDNSYATCLYGQTNQMLFAIEQDESCVVTNTYTYSTSWSNENAELILKNRCGKNYTAFEGRPTPYILTSFDGRNYLEECKTIKSGCVKHSGLGLHLNSNYMILSINGESPAKYPKIWINGNTGEMTFHKLEYTKCEHKYDIKVLSWEYVQGNMFNYHQSTYHLKICKC